MNNIVIEPLDSQLLQNNPLGDPATRQVPVYLPPGYEDTDRRYPVVYLLAGFAGRGSFMLNDSAFDETIAERLDRLITNQQIQPLIVVLPDCFTRYGGSQYLNSSATGRYEDYLVEEVVPFIDQRFRTRAEAGYRAIAGKSSGGYGALVQAMRHPDLFGAVACHSGDIYFEYCYKPDFVKCLNAINQEGLTTPTKLADFLKNFYPKMHPKPNSFFDLIHIPAMAACYSPHPDSPTGFDLPFDMLTGELRSEVWQRWLDFDPLTMVAHEPYGDALRQLKLLYLDCGNRDEYALHYGARIFAKKLPALEIPYVYDEFRGTHRHTQHRYDVSLVAISKAFAD